jgi:hypothetical protein
MLSIDGAGLIQGRLIDSLTLAEMFGLGVQICKAHTLQCREMQWVNEFHRGEYDTVIERQIVNHNIDCNEGSECRGHMRRLHNDVFKDDKLYEVARSGLH